MGKHKGKSVAILVLKEPGYVKWVLDQPDLTGGLEAARDEAERLLSVFDGKPLQKPCYGKGCTNAATYATAGRGISEALYFWCNSCDPYQAGAIPGRLTTIRTYKDALKHVEFCCGGYGGEYRDIVRVLAAAKGLPGRCGEPQAARFFG